MLQGQQLCACRFAAQGEALREAQQHQQDRGPEADASVGRQDADEEGRCAHQDQGKQQDPLAPKPVAQQADDHAPSRAGDESHAEGGKGCEDSAGGVHGREEQRRKHRRRNRAVGREVNPLQRRAERTAERCTQRHGRNPRCLFG